MPNGVVNIDFFFGAVIKRCMRICLEDILLINPSIKSHFLSKEDIKKWCNENLVIN